MKQLILGFFLVISSGAFADEVELYVFAQQYLEQKFAEEEISKKLDDEDIKSFVKSLKKVNFVNKLLGNLVTEDRGSKLLHVLAGLDADDLAATLLRYRYNVNVTDAYGNTPLHIASSEGNLKVAKVLISYGASMRIKNSRGHLPIDICASFLWMQSDICDYLASKSEQ